MPVQEDVKHQLTRECVTSAQLVVTSSVVTGSFGLTMELPDDPIDIMHFGLAVEVTNDHAVEPSAGHGSA